MPPMVAREAVETSTGNHSPCFLSCRLRSSSTMPGSTTQVRPATSSESRRLRCFERSMTMPSLMVCPHCEVPPPRGVTIRPSIPADGQRLQRLVHAAGHHDAGRHDLVERGVGGIAAAVEGVEEDIARNFARKPRGKRAVFRRIPGFFGLRRRHRGSRQMSLNCLAFRLPAWQGKALPTAHWRPPSGVGQVRRIVVFERLARPKERSRQDREGRP